MTAMYPLMVEASRLTVAAWALLPLQLRGGRPAGALMFSFPNTRDFSEDERAFLVALAEQCSQALERARLFDAERRLRAEAEEAKDRELFLADATRVMTSTLDVDAALEALCASAVPRIADWCLVHVIDEYGSIKLVGLGHQDLQLADVARHIGEMFPPDPDAPTGIGAVVRTGRSELYRQVDPAAVEAAARTPEHLELLRRIGFRSLMVVPMRARDRTIGAMTMVSSDPERLFDKSDLAFAEDLASRAALAVDNARLYRRHVETARTLQASLLPPEMPDIPEIDIAARYHPAGQGHEVGGDFYDVFKLSGRSWAVVIGDVCGKDAEAAALTALARYTIRAAAMQTRKPTRILMQLNEAIVHQRSDGRFCTVAFGVLAPSAYGLRLTLACGGHPPAVVVRSDGTVHRLGDHGTLLGLFETVEVHDRGAVLGTGDLVVLYTDGCVEARRGTDLFGEERLLDVIRSCAGASASETAAAVERAVLDFSEGRPSDDVAILALRPRPIEPRP
jgi:serine phosphatase RsbU (regulator of sigma subunit)